MRLLLFILLLISCNSAFCQGDLNEIKSDKILIKNKFNKIYSLGSVKELRNAFGKEKKVIKEQDEALGGYDYTYKYNGLAVCFNGGWQATTVTGADYTIFFDKIAYKIGENINNFKNQFPLSFAHREHVGKDDNRLHIMISNADAYIFVKYNDNGYITEIEVANDNS